MLQVIIPMAGLGSRFTSYGFTKNKYLLPLDTDLKCMIEYAITSLSISVPCIYIFIIRDNISEVVETLRNICSNYSFEYKIVTIHQLTDGPASTVYESLDVIDLNNELIVSNSDQVLKWNFDAFYKECQKYNGCVLTYKPNYELILHQVDKHSFIHLNANGIVDECREKIVLSDKALVGVHYFKKAKYFTDAYVHMVATNLKAPNGEYYLSLAYQSMIENNHSVGYYDLQENENFYPVGEPSDYFKYLYDCGGYKSNITHLSPMCYKYDIYNDDTCSISYNKKFIENEYIENIGLILIIEGTALDTQNQLLCANKITNSDIIIKEQCIFFLIQYNGYNPKTSLGIWDVNDFTRGWFIGNFTPSIIRTDHLEVAKLTHTQGENCKFHYHSLAIEINVLLKGKMSINNIIIEKDNTFVVKRNEIACPIFHEDCEVLCVKIPSRPLDKYII